MTSPIIDAQEMLRHAAARHGVCFSVLVAETSIWAAPEVHFALVESGSPAWFPNTRRGRNSTEKRGASHGGIIFDDNTKANISIKLALGRQRQSLIGFETCHIWEKTCYNTEYHTAVANLVLLPRALAGLSDHDPEVARALRYRSFELYGWHPIDENAPQKPAEYPNNWRPPEPFNDAVKSALTRRERTSTQKPLSRSGVANTASRPLPPQSTPTIAAGSMEGAMTLEERERVTQRVRLWANRPDQISHKAVAIVFQHEPGGIHRSTLVERLKHFSKSPEGVINSLRRSDGNNYGRVFVQSLDGCVRIHPSVRSEILSHAWSMP